MADEDATGASVATPAPISTRKHMSLANEGHAIVRGVVHDVVEAAADQVYLNVLDRSYLHSYAATRCFDDMMRTIGMTFMPRPPLPSLGAVGTTPPGAADTPLQRSGAWLQEPEPVPNPCDSNATWQVPTKRRPKPEMPAEPVVEESPYGRHRRRRRSSTKQRRRRRGSQQSTASPRGGGPIHVVHTSGTDNGMVYDAYSFEAQFAMNVTPLDDGSQPAAPGAKPTDGSQFKQNLAGFSLDRPNTAGIQPIVTRDGVHKGLFDTSARFQFELDQEEVDRRVEFNEYLRRQRDVAAAKRARKAREQAEAAQMVKRRKALKGKTVTVDSTVEGGLVFYEPAPKAVLDHVPDANINGVPLEQLPPYDEGPIIEDFDESQFIRKRKPAQRRRKKRQGRGQAQDDKPKPLFSPGDMQGYTIDATSRSEMFPSTVDATTIGPGARGGTPARSSRRSSLSRSRSPQKKDKQSSKGSKAKPSPTSPPASRMTPVQHASPARLPRRRLPRGGDSAASPVHGSVASPDGDSPGTGNQQQQHFSHEPKRRNKPSARTLQKTIGYRGRTRDRVVGRAVVSPPTTHAHHGSAGMSSSSSLPELGGFNRTAPLPARSHTVLAHRGEVARDMDALDVLSANRRQRQQFAARKAMARHMPAYMAPPRSPIQGAASAILGLSPSVGPGSEWPGDAASAGFSGDGASHAAMEDLRMHALGTGATSQSFRFSPQVSAPPPPRQRHGVSGDGSRILQANPDAMDILFGGDNVRRLSQSRARTPVTPA